MSAQGVPVLLRELLTIYRRPAVELERQQFQLPDPDKVQISKALAELALLSKEDIRLPGLEKFLKDAQKNSPYGARRWMADALVEVDMSRAQAAATHQSESLSAGRR